MDSKVRRRRIAVVLVTAIAVLLVGVSVASGSFLLTTLDPCEWSDEYVDRIKAVPIEDFVGSAVGPPYVTCSSSQPDTVYRTEQLADGAALPADWWARNTVGTWVAHLRVENTPIGRMVCYVSSQPQWANVQVRVWAGGDVEVSLHRHEPACVGLSG